MNVNIQPYLNQIGNRNQVEPKKKQKRERTVFSSFQLQELEQEFSVDNFLCRTRRIKISQRLALKERQVRLWFQNRRSREKKQQDCKSGILEEQHEVNIWSKNTNENNNDNQIGSIVPKQEKEDFNNQISKCSMGVADRLLSYSQSEPEMAGMEFHYTHNEISFDTKLEWIPDYGIKENVDEMWEDIFEPALGCLHWDPLQPLQ